MSKWVYTLKNGKNLRDAISSEDPSRVLEELERCYDELNKVFPEYLDEDDYEDILEDIENERDNLNNYDRYEMDYDDVMDNIDYLLDKLYDFCDDFKIWVEM